MEIKGLEETRACDKEGGEGVEEEVTVGGGALEATSERGGAGDAAWTVEGGAGTWGLGG